jgi:hypothetical protein
MTTMVSPGRQHHVDDLARGPLDRHFAGAGPAQRVDQAGQALAHVPGDEPLHDLAGHVHHADSVIVVGPVDAAGHPARRDCGQRVWGYSITASSLLAQWGGTLIRSAGTRPPVR